MLGVAQCILVIDNIYTISQICKGYTEFNPNFKISSKFI